MERKSSTVVYGGGLLRKGPHFIIGTRACPFQKIGRSLISSSSIVSAENAEYDCAFEGCNFKEFDCPVPRFRGKWLEFKCPSFSMLLSSLLEIGPSGVHKYCCSWSFCTVPVLSSTILTSCHSFKSFQISNKKNYVCNKF